MTERMAAKVHKLLESKGYSSDAYLLAGLEDVQAHYGVLDDEAIAAVAGYFNLPEEAVRRLVADCAEAFRSAPAADIRICLGPVCRNAGADQLLEQAGDVAVGSFFCMGACDHAPVARVKGRLIPEAEPADLGL